MSCSVKALEPFPGQIKFYSSYSHSSARNRVPSLIKSSFIVQACPRQKITHQHYCSSSSAGSQRCSILSSFSSYTNDYFHNAIHSVVHSRRAYLICDAHGDGFIKPSTTKFSKSDGLEKSTKQIVDLQLTRKEMGTRTKFTNPRDGLNVEEVDMILADMGIITEGARNNTGEGRVQELNIRDAREAGEEEWNDFSNESDDNDEEYYSDDEALFENEQMIKVGDSGYQKFAMVEKVYALKERVQMHMNSGQEPTISSRDLVNLFKFPMDKFQRNAVEAFLEGCSVVVSAPTSSGKTLIAEAAAAAIIAKGRRLFYTTPLKALSNQKLREFRLKFGEQNVGLLTGDAAVNREAPIVVMTTEILRNMLYSSVGSMDGESGLRDVDAIVLDEVHYLSDISRGTVWEETIIYCPKEIQLICLSATVANAGELTNWIKQIHGPTKLIASSRRPVPLMWHFSTRNRMVPLLNDKKDDMNWRLKPESESGEEEGEDYAWEQWGISRKKLGKKPRTFNKDANKRTGATTSSTNKQLSSQGRNGQMAASGSSGVRMSDRRQVPRISDTLQQLTERQMLPAIWFIFSRRGCDAAVDILSDMSLLSPADSETVRRALETFRTQFPEAVREGAEDALTRGIAAHHAGCLPAWKGFVEELYQQGLIKVVFATETLAAGINMPARTAVLSTLSKRGDTGHALLSANAMLQMAGRAGRRGLDEVGHAVVVQTPFEGASEACQLLFAGPDALTSQFTATFGMALNLLAGSQGIRIPEIAALSLGEVPEPSPPIGSEERRFSGTPLGRSMEEAKSLVERSFGNYLGSEVVEEARKELRRLESVVEELKEEQKEAEAAGLSELEDLPAWQKYLQERDTLRHEKRELSQLRRKAGDLRLALAQPVLEGLLPARGAPPAVVLVAYADVMSGEDRVMPALFVDRIAPPKFLANGGRKDDVEFDGGVEGDEEEAEGEEREEEPPGGAELLPASSPSATPALLPHFVALGADNFWYVFTAKSVQGVHQWEAGAASGKDEREALKESVQAWEKEWTSVGRTAGVYRSPGANDSWQSSQRLPLPGTLRGPGEIQACEDLLQLDASVSQQRKKVSLLRKKIKSSVGYREHRRMVSHAKRRADRIARMEKKGRRIRDRLARIQPTGWPEFVQAVNALKRAGAVDPTMKFLLPLGETALALRGVNELWLAAALLDPSLGRMKPSQLAAACASLVTEGVKARTTDSKGRGGGVQYEPSAPVYDWARGILPMRDRLVNIQIEENVEIPCILDPTFSGVVEAWASGVSWKELMDGCGLDEGDVARLLRRTIDLLSQVPHLPNVDVSVRKLARQAAVVMDRPPISELIG